MKLVTLALNPLEPDTWETYEVDNVCDFLLDNFVEWPKTAKIYHNYVATTTDITPSCDKEIENLNNLEGHFYVIVYPAGVESFLWIVVLVVAAVAAVVLNVPKPPIPTIRNTQSASPNNELSSRTNQSRPNARIPDIYGTVRSTPDLIAVPYKVFSNHEEVEYAYMCIGRGSYQLDSTKIYDDTTRVSDIAGTSVEVYAPNTSPNSGDAPQLSIGSPINTPVLNAVRSNAVNGQVLRPPNDQNIVGNSNIRFSTPNEIQTSSFDFTDRFAAGDTLLVEDATEYTDSILETRTIVAFSAGYFRFEIPSSTLPSIYQSGLTIKLTGAAFTEGTTSPVFLYDLSGEYVIDGIVLESGVITPIEGYPYTQYYCRVNLVSPETINPSWSDANGTASKSVSIRIITGVLLYDLSGTYTVLSVSDSIITLSSPSTVNPTWSEITTTSYVSPKLSTSGPKWIGPFVLDKTDLTEVFSNLVAANGLYKDNGTNQSRTDVTCEIELTPIDIAGDPIGSAELFQGTLEGSATLKSQRAITIKANPTFTGRCMVRARRITPSDLSFQGSVVDEIKWRDVYSVSPVTQLHFGDVTTVQSVTYATAGALAIKERKLNMIVTRKIPRRISGSTFSSILYPTNDAAEIISAICLDPRIGNRSVSEIDFDSIYDTVADIKNYFGSDKAAEFCYTFDSTNLSFEESVKSIADSIFCTAYRRGNIIKLSFEKETENSTLLFNHRNKLPGSETRTINFGTVENHDGVSYQYTDPDDDAVVTYYIPEDRSAINPKEIESIGIRNKLQARFHAWRLYNKIKYQNIVTEFTATQEAELLVTTDRILVADNTRTGTQDGEVISQNVLELTLSQNVDLTVSPKYNIFLQLPDGTVDSIGITQGTLPNQVILSRPPMLPLALDDENYARTTYMISGSNDTRESSFLVKEKESQGNFTSIVRAINYDSRYYSNDLDYINLVVDENGNDLP